MSKRRLLKVIKIIGLVTTSFLVSIVLLYIFLLLTVKFFWKGEYKGFLLWTTMTSTYSPEYIYWPKSVCDTEGCTYQEEKLLPLKMQFFGQCTEEQKTDRQTMKILFLGDSFTHAPWVEDNEHFPAVFSAKLAEHDKNCVKMYRLAAPGSGNHQQLARFMDVVSKLKPDMVVWQFYWNDLGDNVRYELFKVDGDQLVRKKAWDITLFWAGWLNQNVPFLDGTQLGKFIMNIGETRDLFGDRVQKSLFGWREENAISFPLLMKEMNSLAQKNNFMWISTLAPLECRYIDAGCQYADFQQDLLLEMLEEHSSFVPMDTPEVYTLTLENVHKQEETAQVLGKMIKKEDEQFFNQDKDINRAGWRHLSNKGNIYFGELLFEHFQVKIAH
jgi:hypothetical protein